MPDETPTTDAWKRLREALTAPRRTQFLVAGVACLVSFAVVTQIQTHGDDEMYRTARRAELIQLVDGQAEESRRLESEIADLEETRRELVSGSDARQVARHQAESRLDALSVLAGTAPASGPGIRLTITDPELKVGPSILLDAIGEMRDSGAEVMEFNDMVRVTGTSWVGGVPGALVVDDATLPDRLVLEAIGDPQTLEEAARFRGGLVSEVTAPQVGGSIEIEQLDHVVIRSVKTTQENVFARPAR